MKQTIKVHTKNKSEIIYGDEGQTLLETLAQNGFSPDAPCGGNGTCGKCRVKVLGSVTPVTERERALLGSTYDNNYRLSCQTYPLGTLSVWLDDNAPSFPAPTFRKHKLKIDPNVVFDKSPILGVSFDIGTTGITAALYDLISGIKLKEICEENSQKPYGADIISRITQSIKAQDGLTSLCTVLREQLDTIIKNLHRKTSEIHFITVAANTALLHFLTNLSPAGLAAAPYTPANRFGIELSAVELGISCSNARVFLMPAISGFVGADITAGILATGMHRKKNYSFLIDIGTNGEMVAGNKDGLLCCSAAAGPAFEGAGISCGMPARPGAINFAEFEDGKIKIHTIDNAVPRGICGSGIIDLTALLVRFGAVNAGGRLLPKLETPELLRDYVEDTADGVIFKLARNVFITAKDVRAIQLSKAAIRSGIETLLNKSGKNYKDVRTLYLAGAFGSLIRKESAAAIGLIPPQLITCTVAVGNTSAEGAAMALLSKRNKSELFAIQKMVGNIELSGNNDFMNEYINSMPFE